MNVSTSSKPRAPRSVEPAPARETGAPPQRSLCIGGLTPFSTLDFPGQLAAVVFVQGCAWRCLYCHNPHLQRRDEPPAGAPQWPEVRAWLQRRVGLLDGVVFSGGEPTTDAGLAQAIGQSRKLGLRVGLHTAGLYPGRLEALLPELDWVGLDIKAPLSDGALHTDITGVPGSVSPVQRSLRLLVESGIEFECRTTAHPNWLDDSALTVLAAELADAGVKRFALQLYRREGTERPHGAVAPGYPSAAVLDTLQTRFETFTLRGA